MNAVNPRNILGGFGFFEDFETEKAVSSIAKGVGSVIEEIVGLGQDIAGVEPESEAKPATKFSSGSINFKENQSRAQTEQLQKQQAEITKERTKIDRKKAFFQALKEDMERAQKAKDKLLFEEEINDIATNLPTDEKNRLLHYQASYRDRSVYQRAELRRKIIEQQKKSEKQEKAASIPSPAKKASAMEGAFEGGSGTQGSGTANLSAQAVG